MLALTCNLFLQPLEPGSRQPLFRRAICKSVRNRDIFEVLEDGALHCQLVQVGIQKGYDALWEGRRAVEVHAGLIHENNALEVIIARSPTTVGRYGADVKVQLGRSLRIGSWWMRFSTLECWSFLL